MEYIVIITGLLLVLIGLWGLLSRRDMIRIILGFGIFDTGLNIVFLALGYISNGTAPILDQEVGISGAIDKIVDPIPQSLVLTSIVIGFGVSSLMLAYAMKMYEAKGTLDIQKFKDLKG